MTQNTRVLSHSLSLNFFKKMYVFAQQCCAIKFCVHLKKMPSETTMLLKEAFGKETLGDSTIRQWHKAFIDGRGSAEFKPPGGVPGTVVMSTNINTIAAVSEEDRHVTVQTIDLHCEG